MVLTQRHPHAGAHGLHQAIARIQPTRVLGLAGAIALNTVALMLLLVPVSAPMRTVIEDDIWQIYEPARQQPPPEPIEEVAVVAPQPVRDPRPTTVTPPLPQPAQDTRSAVPDGSEYAPPQTVEPAFEAGPALPPDTGPAAGAQPSTRLEYAMAPAPPYPRDALLDGVEGTVLLRVLVDEAGKPLSVDVERSSGHRRLDEAARRQVLRRWSFRPAIRDGRAVQVYGMVPVHFRLSAQ